MRKPTVSSDSVARDQLRAFVERIERMNEERKAIADDIKEIYAEARGNGFDVKALKIVVREREQDSNERMELEAILELYRAALGMAAYPRDDDDDYQPGVGIVVATPARARDNSATSPVAADQDGSARPSLSSDPIDEQPTAAAQGETPDANTHGQTGTADISGLAASVPANAEAVAKQVGQSEQEAAVELPVDTPSHSPHSEADQADSGPQAAEGLSNSRAPTAAENALSLRPYCLHAHDLHNCAGQGRKHCHSCMKSHADAEGLAA